MKKLYTAHATSIGGREGSTETDKKEISAKLVKPGSSGGTNPEQLFACGYSACFGGAVMAVAKKHGHEMANVEVKAEVNLNQDDNGFFISAALDVALPKIERKQAEQIVAEAHEMCPYSKATRGNIVVDLKVNGEEMSIDTVSSRQAIGAAS